MAWESLQPSSLFERERSQDIPSLVRKSNDKFWVIPIGKYQQLLVEKVNIIKSLDRGSKEYLIALVEYMGGKKTIPLASLYKKNNIPDTDIIKNFGEVLGPFFALTVLQKSTSEKMHNIVFPTRQNYEIFDFFVKDGIHYGFSSKALKGGSNPLVPRLFIERMTEMKTQADFRNFQVEIDVLRALTDGGMFSGVVNAFGLMMEKKKLAEGFDSKVYNIFRNVNFAADAVKLEKNKEEYISKLKLSNQKAYESFLTEYVFDKISTQKKQETKAMAKKDKDGYGLLCVNVVFGMIKYISSVSDFKFDDIMKALFPDLNIIKMGLTKDGIPQFHLQTTADATKVFQLDTYHVGDEYAFRSKASWDRVRDKLGIQL